MWRTDKIKVITHGCSQLFLRGGGGVLTWIKQLIGHGLIVHRTPQKGVGQTPPPPPSPKLHVQVGRLLSPPCTPVSINREIIKETL